MWGRGQHGPSPAGPNLSVPCSEEKWDPSSSTFPGRSLEILNGLQKAAAKRVVSDYSPAGWEWISAETATSLLRTMPLASPCAPENMARISFSTKTKGKLHLPILPSRLPLVSCGLNLAYEGDHSLRAPWYSMVARLACHLGLLAPPWATPARPGQSRSQDRNKSRMEAILCPLRPWGERSAGRRSPNLYSTSTRFLVCAQVSI